MFTETCSLARDFAAVLCTGVAVKLMDDHLDRHVDMLVGQKTLAQWLDTAVTPYALLFLAAACALNASLAASLFFASYTTGMVYDLRQKLPSGLRGYQESLAVVVLGCWWFGVREMLAAVLIMLLVQLADDWLDICVDQTAGQNNLVRLLGRTESILAGAILFLLACVLAPYKLLLVLGATPLVVFFLTTFPLRR